MKIYTRTGDSGETGLIGGRRVKKHAVRIEAYGTVDELAAVLGVVRAQGPSPDLDQILVQLQNDLFGVGAELATTNPKGPKSGQITEAYVQRLEQTVDRCEEELPELKNFILPAGTATAALLHLGRAVCRRAERRVVELAETEPVSGRIIEYLNRLSDLLFVLARLENLRSGLPDEKWMSGRQ